MSRILPWVFLMTIVSCGKNTAFRQTVDLPGYPSSSGIEFLDNKIYLVGDDASHLLILDEELHVIDSIPLYTYPEKRIPKTIKADLESIAITKDKKIFLVGSGSLSPNRDVGWLIDPRTKQKDSVRLDSFYHNLKMNGIEEINIEGACSVTGGFLLANRGNKSYPKNFLILTSNYFYRNQTHAPVSLIRVGSSADTTIFNGVSGLAYSAKTDRLIMSVSTEATGNNFDDGAIGKSYIWIIKSFNSKKRWQAINPDQVIDLENLDAKLRGQKIESVCITKETRNFLYLLLCADNDDGASRIFSLVVEKE